MMMALLPVVMMMNDTKKEITPCRTVGEPTVAVKRVCSKLPPHHHNNNDDDDDDHNGRWWKIQRDARLNDFFFCFFQEIERKEKQKTEENEKRRPRHALLLIQSTRCVCVCVCATRPPINTSSPAAFICLTLHDRGHEYSSMCFVLSLLVCLVYSSIFYRF